MVNSILIGAVANIKKNLAVILTQSKEWRPDGDFNSAVSSQKAHPQCESSGSFGRLLCHVGCAMLTPMQSLRPTSININQDGISAIQIENLL